MGLCCAGARQGDLQFKENTVIDREGNQVVGASCATDRRVETVVISMGAKKQVYAGLVPELTVGA